jgi:hypothetical protein
MDFTSNNTRVPPMGSSLLDESLLVKPAIGST